MRSRVNYMRKYVAQRTKCLEYRAKSLSLNGWAEYQSPAEMLSVFDVWYDGNKLNRVIPRNMNKLRDGTIPEGVPTSYCFYGGENQPSSLIYLYPTPNEDEKEIKIHAIWLPEDIVLLDKADNELPPMVQWLVEEGVVLELLGNEERTDPRLPLRVAMWRRKINENINCRVL